MLRDTCHFLQIGLEEIPQTQFGGNLCPSLQAPEAFVKGTCFRLSFLSLSWRLLAGCCLELSRDYLSRFHVDLHNTTSSEICHILFANDTLIMCDLDRDQILNLDHILLCLEGISGLKINLRKSELVAVGKVPNQEELVDILNYTISSLPLKYLGLLLGAPFKSKAILDGVVEKIEKRLASWKKIYLCRGGHLTLIKSTLSSLPTYFMSHFHLPASIARRLERIQRDFLWNGFDCEQKP